MYELVYIVRPTADEQTLAAVKDRVDRYISSAGGSVVKRDDWGKRTFAYPILKFTEGFYSVLQFDMPTSGLRDLERSLGLTEEVLRHIVVRTETTPS